MLVPSECLRNHYLFIRDLCERSILLSLGHSRISVSFFHVTNWFSIFPSLCKYTKIIQYYLGLLFRFWARRSSNLLWKHLASFFFFFVRHSNCFAAMTSQIVTLPPWSGPKNNLSLFFKGIKRSSDSLDCSKQKLSSEVGWVHVRATTKWLHDRLQIEVYWYLM